jgi:hypothetical protein
MPSGDTTAIVRGDLNVPVNTRLNVLLINTPEFIEARTVSFPLNLAEDPQRTFLRVVHVGPDLGRIDVAITDASGLRTVLQNIPFRSNTAFVDYPKGMIRVEVFRAGTDTLIQYGERRVDGNSHVTLFVAGLLSNPRLFLLNESSVARQELLQLLDGQSRVRLVNVRRGAGDIRLFLDTNAGALLGGIGFREASGFATIAPGTHRYYGLGSTPGDTLFASSLSAESNSVTTVIHLVDSSADSMPIILTRSLDRVISADSALVRYVSAVNDTAGLTYTLVDEEGNRFPRPLTHFKDYTDYVAVPSGRVTIEISRDATVLFRRRGFVDGGEAYTLIATGAYAPDSAFQMNLLRDSDSTHQDPLVRMTEPKGAFRVAHVAPNGNPVEIFLDENPGSARLLRYRDASALTDNYVDSLSVKAARSGRGIASAFFDTTAVFGPDTLATLFLLSTSSDTTISSVLLYSAEQDLPDSGAAIRFLHGSYDAGNVNIRIRLSDGSFRFIAPFDFKGSSAYIPVKAGRTRVAVFAGNDTTLKLLDVEGRLDEEGLYTAVLTGERLENSLGVNLLVDTRDAEQVPMILLGPPAGVRTSTGRESIGLSVAPNPTAADAVLRLRLERPATIDLMLYDLDGVVRMRQSDLRLGAGTSALDLPIADLPSGSYTLVLRDASGAIISSTRVTIVR